MTISGARAILRQAGGGALRKDVIPTGDTHQFTDRADAADFGLVPFLEINTGTSAQVTRFREQQK